MNKRWECGWAQQLLRERRRAPQVGEAPRQRERRDDVGERQDLLDEAEAGDQVRLEELLQRERLDRRAQRRGRHGVPRQRDEGGRLRRQRGVPLPGRHAPRRRAAVALASTFASWRAAALGAAAATDASAREARVPRAPLPCRRCGKES